MPLRVVVPAGSHKRSAPTRNAPVAWAASYTGPRAENQDYYGRADHETPGYDWSKSGCLYVLADGMGGLACGAQAARMAVKEVIENFKNSRDDVTVSERLAAAITEANRKIYLAGQGASGRMGSTVVACVLKNGHVTVAHAGDSRAYLLRNGQLFRCTTDHLYATEVLGMADEDAAKRSTEGHKITRALGKDPELSLEPEENEHRPEDRFLLCSDGVSEALPDTAIQKCLAEPSPRKAVQALMASAGPHLTDNATAVVVFASGKKIRRRAAMKHAAWAVAATLLLAGAGFGSYRYGERGIAHIEKLLATWTKPEVVGSGAGNSRPSTSSTEAKTGDNHQEPKTARSGEQGESNTSRTSSKTRPGAKQNGRAAAELNQTASAAATKAEPGSEEEHLTTTPPSPLTDEKKGDSQGRNLGTQLATPNVANPQPGTGPDHSQDQTTQPSAVPMPPGASAQRSTAPTTPNVSQPPGTAGQPHVADPSGKKDSTPAKQQTVPAPTPASATVPETRGSHKTGSSGVAVPGKRYLTITNNTGEDVEVRGSVGGERKTYPTLHLFADESKQVSYDKWATPPDQVWWRKDGKHMGGWHPVTIESGGAMLVKTQRRSEAIK